nr:subtilisin-like protease SBT4.14 [Ipomoea batatas]
MMRSYFVLRMLGKRHFHCLPTFYLCLLLITTGPQNAEADSNKGSYIVFLKDHHPVDEETAFQNHIDLLSSLKGSLEATESHVYSYTRVFNAFAAKLSEDEADELSRLPEVASVIPNRYHKLHTTRSWEFIGLPPTARRNLKAESNIIVGVLDTGYVSLNNRL